jgi:hypothetical protein
MQLARTVASRNNSPKRFPNDIDCYVAGNTEMIAGFLTAAGMPPDEVATILQINTDVA